jgi:hypothetical protein
MNPTLSAQASRAAQQGQRMLVEDRNRANAARGQYNTYSGQVSGAQKELQSQAKYMQGAGSGINLYNTQLSKLQSESGYNPAQLADANKSLFSMTGALNSANNQFNTPGGVGAYGMSAPALASYEGSILQPLQTGVSNANTMVGTLNSELQNFMTGASQAATVGVQSEQNVVDALNKAVVNYQAQASDALQNMQFYSKLASDQGGLNAQQAQNYAQAQQAYAASQQALAQASLFMSQTRGQNIANIGNQRLLDEQARKPAPPVANAQKTAATVGGSSHAPDVWQDNKDFWTGTAPRAVGGAAKAVGRGAVGWGKGLLTGASW